MPNPAKEEEMLLRWITVIGGSLSEMSLQEIYEKKRIWKCHFLEKFSNPGKKALLRTAIPTLFLPSEYMALIRNEIFVIRVKFKFCSEKSNVMWWFAMISDKIL